MTGLQLPPLSGIVSPQPDIAATPAARIARDSLLPYYSLLSPLIPLPVTPLTFPFTVRPTPSPPALGSGSEIRRWIGTSVISWRHARLPGRTSQAPGNTTTTTTTNTTTIATIVSTTTIATIVSATTITTTSASSPSSAKLHTADHPGNKYLFSSFII
ncbi:hypothetical protein E2C01_066942 [Portunus trituberculatus]|uniref:Uncharacterized protein n=1 Tax=Portunus trituberculatus TaxID=210409 RepID=A0A5B7HSA7_PORTR|nr:hypothetical protein [Portunus trituberculatus]